MGKVDYNQKGYVGQKMSERAVEAYDHGEMPKSKWTKKAMLETIAEEIDLWDISEDAIKIFESYKKDDLFDKFFKYSSWHHTGKFANCTDFYSLREESVRKELIKHGYSNVFINSKNPEIREEVAKQGYGFDKLINDENWEVREAVAEQGYGLDKLINDEIWVVRKAVAEQGYGLDKLIEDNYSKIDNLYKSGLISDNKGARYDVRDMVDLYLEDNNYKDINDWIKKNPDKCVLPENKQRKPQDKMPSAKDRARAVAGGNRASAKKREER